jgi:sulfite reductase (ferredoxin)
MAEVTSWKEQLTGHIRPDWAEEIDVFETQLALKRQGKIDDKLFAETRLRRGAYGQRYDNGQRHDGTRSRTLAFPSDLTKGPGTFWEAPGMMRIKIPFGAISADQLDVLAELAEEYSDSILHVTTRQDIQLHYVHLDDTPDLMRRLATVGITTREACGNSVRNVTACPYSGVCQGEQFDVTPYAHALAFFLLGHDDVQDFGRKFKIAFSGCEDGSCGLTNIHDIGCIATTREVDGELRRGFRFYVGGGLGAVPHAAKLLDEFVTEEELLPLAQAVCRVFAQLGERENRARARLKFVVKKLGIEAFAERVREEREKLRPDPRWTAYLADLHAVDEQPLRAGGVLDLPPVSGGFETWRCSNVRAQRQPGYVAATITLPLGDFTSDQARGVADAMRQFTGDTLRASVDQNLVVRWIPETDLPSFYAVLRELGLAEPGADTIRDVTSCPGTDTCKLGISSSRGLAVELRRRLSVIGSRPGPAQHLRVKCSGCFNACGQHHIADIGFLGVSRNVGGRRVPHFQLVIGGQYRQNGGAFGLAVGAVPSKRVPELLEAVTERFTAEREEDESFQAWVGRLGRKEWRKLLDRFTHVPPHEQDPTYYADWGDPREYTIGDIGVGECAGEVVNFTDMELQASEREVFEAQVQLDDGAPDEAARRAYKAMVVAARALTRRRNANVGDAPDEVVREFRAHLYDTRVFHDPYAGGKFAHYLFRVHEQGTNGESHESAHQLIEEAQLFVEAAHQCYHRMTEAGQ